MKLPDITGGVYLVIDPSMDRQALLDKTQNALEGGLQALQVWNHWPDGTAAPDKEKLIGAIVDLAEEYLTPVLINDDWTLLKSTCLHGVHFDTVPGDYGRVRKEIGRDYIAGVTCSNDLEVIRWAEEYELDYVSFCSMFPSESAGECEIVRHDTVKKAREITSMPLFISGGVTPGNLERLIELDFDGAAVISGILNADDPEKAAEAYREALQENKKGMELS